jgi:hypothetical protein
MDENLTPYASLAAAASVRSAASLATLLAGGPGWAAIVAGWLLGAALWFRLRLGAA